MLKAEQNEPNDLRAEAALGLKAERALHMQQTRNVKHHVYLQHLQLRDSNFAKTVFSSCLLMHRILFTYPRHAMKGDSKMLEKIAALLLSILLCLYCLNAEIAALLGYECPPRCSHQRK